MTARRKPDVAAILTTIDGAGEQLAKTAGDVRAAIEQLVTAGVPWRSIGALVQVWRDEAKQARADGGPSAEVAAGVLEGCAQRLEDAAKAGMGE